MNVTSVFNKSNNGSQKIRAQKWQLITLIEIRARRTNNIRNFFFLLSFILFLYLINLKFENRAEYSDHSSESMDKLRIRKDSRSGGGNIREQYAGF